ncbi:hypothetical protein [Paraburkholderia sp. RL18-085-BIA-A]|uniref:hypothetical protein n=1 Tax=Paraburkholderia sp. RL18-085-BIA-A TaxID=3031633 RepID=UPI0038BD4008
MIRIALCLLLGGCVQVLPTVDQSLNVGCCIAYVELSKSTSGSIEVQKSPTNWSVSAKVHSKF